MEPSFKDMTDEQRTACAALLGTLQGEMSRLDASEFGSTQAVALEYAYIQAQKILDGKVRELFESYPPPRVS